MGAAREPICCCSLIPAAAAAAVLALLLLLLLLFLFPILCLLPAPQAAIVCLKAFILSTMKPHNLAAVCQPHQVVNQPGRLPPPPPPCRPHKVLPLCLRCDDLLWLRLRRPPSTVHSVHNVHCPPCPVAQYGSTLLASLLRCCCRCGCGCCSVELKLYLIS